MHQGETGSGQDTQGDMKQIIMAAEYQPEKEKKDELQNRIPNKNFFQILPRKPWPDLVSVLTTAKTCRIQVSNPTPDGESCQ
jgi:hypothetical protein